MSVELVNSSFSDQSSLTSIEDALFHQTVPEGFAQVLNQFAKEVLRHQPPNTLDFAAEYFENLKNERDQRGVS